MARTFPRQLPNRVRQDPKRRAEVRLYDALQEQLGVGWRVFYSVAWLGRTHAEGAPRDGEADFVIAHPAHGISVVEVKGGGIRFDGMLSKWSSTNDEGTYEIKDPFLQAVRSKNALLQKLRSLPSWSRFWIPMGHAVAFPSVLESTVDEQIWPPHADRRVILCNDDLPRLASRLRQVADFWLHQTPSGLPLVDGDALMEDLERLLAPVTELPNPLRAQIAEQNQEIIKLTEWQYSLLAFLNSTRRASISGCAGSGKTAYTSRRSSC